MKTTYLVWKDSAVSGDYIQISGKEFLALVRLPENKGRHFIKLLNVSEYDRDGAIIMETTKDEYVEWRNEKRRREYLQEINPGIKPISYHAIESDDGRFGEELLADNNCDIEQDYISALEPDLLKKALSLLTDEEYRLIEYIYLLPQKGTERGYSTLIGVPKSTVNRYKLAIFEKIKKIIEE